MNRIRRGINQDLLDLTHSDYVSSFTSSLVTHILAYSSTESIIILEWWSQLICSLNFWSMGDDLVVYIQIARNDVSRCVIAERRMVKAHFIFLVYSMLMSLFAFCN